MKKLFTILFFALFIWGFSTDAKADERCYRYPTLSFAPTETKLYEDVKYEYTAPIKKFRVGYSNYIFKKSTAKSCHNLELTLWFSNSGEKLEKPESIGLYFTSDATFPKYGTFAKRRFKVFDGRKLIFSRDLEYEKEYRETLKNYSEILSTDVSLKTFTKIAEAENLSFYIGKTEIKLTEKDLNAIKQIVQIIENIK